MSVACVLQEWRGAGALAGALVLGATSLAQSSVVPIFTTSSDTITAGGQDVLNLHLDLLADPGNYGAQFAGGSVTFYSGVGSSTSFDLGFGGSARDFSYAFSYTDPGTYTPSFTLTGSYTQSYDANVQIGSFPKTVLVSSKQCTFPCFTYATTLIPIYEKQTFSDSQAFSLRGDTMLTADPVATPLPAALPLYATCLGLIALLAWRRRRRVARQA
jgi:hypothetical protein